MVITPFPARQPFFGQGEREYKTNLCTFIFRHRASQSSRFWRRAVEKPRVAEACGRLRGAAGLTTVANVNPASATRIARHIGWPILGLALIGGLFGLWLRPRAPQADLARYSPQETLAFVETESLPSALRQIETLAFWKAIKPAIGFPGQLDDVLTGARFIEWLDAGPAEARLLARARWGIAITGLAAETSPPASPNALRGGKDQPSDGATLDLKPRFALLLSTGLAAEQIAAIARERLPAAARRLFGQPAQLLEQPLAGGILLRFRHAERPETSLWAATQRDLLLIANDEAALQACLDTSQGRRAALADLPAFGRARQAVRREQSLLFAFVNPRGLDAALRLGPLNWGRSDTASLDGQEQSLTASLLTGLSDGLGYSLSIEDGQVADRYYLGLHSQIVAALRPHLPPALDVAMAQRLLAARPGELTVATLSRPLAALDRLQAALAARSNPAVAFLSREAMAGLRERYGIGPRDPLDDALGDQWVLISLDTAPDGKSIVGAQVRDKARLLPTLDRYLRADGASLVTPSPTHSGIPLVVSTRRDGRAACFLDDWLFLGDQAALERWLTQRLSEPSPLPKITPPPPDAFLYRYYQPSEDLKSVTLALIALARAGEASPARLEEAAVKRAIAAQAVASGHARLGDDGCFGEMRSPIGNLAYLASLINAL
ncbi:MAG: hypothetical protein CFK52_07150 [Chloracidobacterium sp. CP2_5A]|nr:MAG: hypothetical protein CFK52_07150 [Chloracidobacterium sp. CP2_5A]